MSSFIYSSNYSNRGKERKKKTRVFKNISVWRISLTAKANTCIKKIFILCMYNIPCIHIYSICIPCLNIFILYMFTYDYIKYLHFKLYIF